MTWFRTHRRPGSLLALIALALQLALSFGHVHVAVANPAAVAIAEAGGPVAPPPDSGDRRDADYCAVCAVLSLLSGAQTEAAPVAALPVAIIATAPTLHDETARVTSPRAAFRSRAPPQS